MYFHRESQLGTTACPQSLSKSAPRVRTETALFGKVSSLDYRNRNLIRPAYGKLNEIKVPPLNSCIGAAVHLYVVRTK